MLVTGAIKLVGQVVIGVGVGQFMGALAKSIIPNNATKVVKVAIGIGGSIIGGVVAKAASEKFNGQVDTTEKIVNVIKKQFTRPKEEESKEEKEAE